MTTAALPYGTASLEQPRVVLSAQGLSKTFGGFQAVKNVDLDIHHARVHALIGPNGAGKTTVFNLLTKFIPSTSGTIRLDATDITRMPPAKVARMGLVRSFQISATFPQMTLLENVRVALQRPSGQAVQFWRSLGSLRNLDRQALDLLERVGLQDMRHRLASDLSYGRKRALEIATTLALDPRVLLLDEPLAGMGQEDVSVMAKLISEVAKDRAVLMVEHNLKVVSEICHDVTVLQRGEILTTGTYDTVSADPRVRAAYMGNEDA